MSLLTVPTPRFSTYCLALAVVALTVLSGCPKTVNVRAWRAYAHEDPDLVIALDRVDDISTVLRLLDKALTATPYSPGDDWIGELELKNEKAEAIKEAIRSRRPYDDDDFEVPIVKLYRLHLARVLKGAKLEHQDKKAEYPSLFAAISKDLLGGRASLSVRWKTYQRAVEELAKAERQEEDAWAHGGYIPNRGKTAELIAAEARVEAAEKRVVETQAELFEAINRIRTAKLAKGKRVAIARDALTATSVALRIDLEALAFIPILVVQIARSLPSIHTSVAERGSTKTLSHLAKLPDNAQNIKEHLLKQHVVVEQMATVLSELTETELEQTAGFTLEESVVDQIVGITLDSFHANLNIDGEVFFCHIRSSDGDYQSDDGKKSSSLRGRTRRLDYAVDPIFMFGIKAAVGFDWIQLPDAANLNFGFATDRMWSSGGTIESGSLGEQLGLEGVVSDIFDIGLGLLGVKTDVKIATFTGGEVTEMVVDSAGNDQKVARDANGDERISPFQFTYTQISAGYDISFFFPEWRRYYIEELSLGFRYFDYRLPRILYELKDTNPSPEYDTYVFVRESPAQPVDTTLYMGGARFRWGLGEVPIVAPYLDFGLYFGGGPVEYYFLKDSNKADKSKNREWYAGSAFGMDISLGLGLRVRLTPKKFPLRAFLGAQWRGEFIYESVSQEGAEEEDRDVEFGGNEFFHGSQLIVRGSI